MNGLRKYAAPFDSKCGVVKLLSATEKSTVRADSSASRGNTEEILADSKLLFLPGTDIAVNDRVEIYDINLRVMSKRIRFDVAGRVDHYEVDFMIWE